MGERVRATRRLLVAALVLMVVGGAVAWATGHVPSPRAGADMDQSAGVRTPVVQPSEQPSTGPAKKGRPNIVVVLMDDFSLDLLQTMHSAETMRKRGASYDRAFVVDSLCCVSRSSFFTGQYPHQTGVRTNTSHGRTSDLGGWPAFAGHGNEARSFNVRLQESGYHTTFIGKYLNEYEWTPTRDVPPLPPGWSDFRTVFGSAYDGWEFASTKIEGDRLVIQEHPAPPEWASEEEKDAAYAGQVIEDMAVETVRQRERAGSPYFLEVAVYAPHNRTLPVGHYDDDPLFPPMFRDRSDPDSCGRVRCADLTVDDLPGFGDQRADNRPRRLDGTAARAWNTGRRMSADAAEMHLRDRARMTRSIDRTVRRILRAVGEDTYVILTSDNGLHLGQQGMNLGKGTAYATDVHVPLLVVGPGVEPGVRREVVSNIDLASTFEELAGLPPAPFRSGESLVATFGDPTLNRRSYAFFEHTQQTLSTGDPDAALTGGELDRIPSYTAVRSRDALLVRLDMDPSPDGVDWAYEFYSYRDHDFEKRNTFAQPRHQREVRELMAKLEAFDGCLASVGDAPVTRACRRLTR